MYDRIHIRKIVERIKDDRNFEKIQEMENVIGDILKTLRSKRGLTIDEIYKARKKYNRLYIPKTTIERDILNKAILLADCVDISKVIPSITQIRRKLADSGIKPTDRRFKESLAIIKANAFLSGRMVADTSDLSVFQHILWDYPDQYDVVKSIVYELTNPLASKISEYNEIIDDYVEKVKQKLDFVQIQEITSKLKIVENEIAQLKKDAIDENEDISELEDVEKKIIDLKNLLLEKIAEA